VIAGPATAGAGAGAASSLEGVLLQANARPRTATPRNGHNSDFPEAVRQTLVFMAFSFAHRP
jgi:hypothetical protein